MYLLRSLAVRQPALDCEPEANGETDSRSKQPSNRISRPTLDLDLYLYYLYLYISISLSLNSRHAHMRSH